MTRLIDAERLKAGIFNACIDEHFKPTKLLNWDNITDIINNAPTVEAGSIIDGLNNEIDDLSENLAWYINERNRLLKERRPTGEWIKIFENPFTNGYVCPFCGHKIQVTEQFLPKVTECEVCGAKMKGEEE